MPPLTLNRGRLLFLIGLCLTLVLSGCPGPPMPRNGPLSFVYSGLWQWDSTITPSRVSTPAILGYSQLINLNLGTSVSFYRNDTLQLWLSEAQGDSLRLTRVTDSSSVIKYHKLPTGYVQGKTLYVRYLTRFTNKGEFLILSDTLARYSSDADSVHYYYHSLGGRYPTLYPY